MKDTNCQTIIKFIFKPENYNILIVEDSKSINKILYTTFSEIGYNTFQAFTLKEALKILDEQCIDLILLDVELKDENGIEFLQKNKIELIDKRNIPVIIVSGSIDSSAIRNALKAGAVDLIKKPYIIEEIVLKVDLWIDYKRKDDEIKCSRQLLDQYKSTVDRSSIVSKTDKNGNITYVNDRFCDISGFNQSELIGQKHSLIRHPDMPKEAFADIWNTIKVLKQPWVGQVKNKKKDGTAYWVDTVINPILDDKGNILEYIGIRSDVTDMINPKKTILDIVTNAKAPLLMIAKIADWDILKEFYGQKIANEIEDEFEQEVLKHFEDDCQFEKVYRLNNGEYGFYRDFDEYTDELTVNINDRLKRFQENVRKSIINFGIGEFNINIIISYALEKEFLFESVELGLKKAITKKLDIICANKLSQKAHTKAKNNLETIKMIKTAIENNKIISYFQPIVDNKTKKIVKYESLVRLINDNDSIISPYFFLDMSKKGSYYNQITNIVIDNSFDALQKTDKEISINLSALDIENKETREKLIELISKDENYGRIVFELLEDEIVNDFTQIKDFLSLVRRNGGVKIAIDDFGAGYSNFERILDYQPDILKIDGSLIKNIATDKFSLDVVEAIVTFAKKQDIQIVAEYVENEDIYNVLNNLGIEYSQGYYFGKPEPLILKDI